MTQGLGEKQEKKREETDKKIWEFIKKHPSSHVRGIIKQLGMSPNAVTQSIKRLLESKKIILLIDSDVFYKLKNKDTKKRKSLVCHYPELEETKKVYFDRLKQEMDSILDELEKGKEEEKNKIRPYLNQLSENFAVLINGNHYPTLLKLKNALGVKKVNESMIGVYLFRLLKKTYLEKNNIDRDERFYLDLLPDKYTHIKFEDAQDQKDFISLNMNQTSIT